MKISTYLALAAINISVISPALGQIEISGSFDPPTASSWTGGGSDTLRGVLGTEAGNSSLSVQGGSVLDLRSLETSVEEDAFSQITVAGTGSQLNVDDFADFAIDGNSNLTVSNGGTVSVGEDAILGRNAAFNLVVESGGRFESGNIVSAFFADSVANITVTGAASEFVVNGDFSLADDGISVMDVLEGATATVNGLFRLAAFDSASQATLNVDGAGTQFDVTGTMILGEPGTAEVNVTNQAGLDVQEEIIVGGEGDGTQSGRLIVEGGATVESGGATLVGDSPDSTGFARFSGADTTLTVGENFFVGTSGDGTVELLDGVTMAVQDNVVVGLEAEASGNLSLRGAGTTLTGEELLIAQGGPSVVNVSQGAQITMNDDIRIFSNGTMNIQVDGDNMVVAGNVNDGSENFENNGQVFLIASGELASGDYSPIDPGDGFEGTGTYEGVGGTWNDATGQFEVADITTDTSGSLGGKRIEYDPDLVVGFAESVGVLDFVVVELSIPTINGEQVLLAFDFDTTLEDQLTALSFKVGAGLDDSLFNIWYREDELAAWVLFDPIIQGYDGEYFTFGVDEFSGYAVTQVPEPTTGFLLLGALSSVLLARRR